MPVGRLKCEKEYYKKIEWELRSRIYYHEHLKDDAPIEEEFHVYKIINNEQTAALPYGQWGLEIKRHYNDTKKMFSFEQSLNNIEDISRLKTPELSHDEKATLKDFEKKQEILGDILPVMLKGYTHISFHMMERYSGLRGLNQMYLDFYENPDMVHQVMEIFTNGYINMIDAAAGKGLLEVNNYSSYVSTGGKSYTHELPAEGYDGKVRTKDLWASAESQELSGVSPSMHKEFALDYEKRILD